VAGGDRDEEDDVLSIERDLPSSVNLKTTVINNFTEQGILDKSGKFHPYYQTPSGMAELFKTSHKVYGHHSDYAKTVAEIASDATKKAIFGLSPAGFAKVSMFGSNALSGTDKAQHKTAAFFGKAPKYIPGIADVTQGYYTDSDGNQQPISNQGISPTEIPGTSFSVNTSPLGLLNEQSGMISPHGGQPLHHISGLLEEGKNLQNIRDAEYFKQDVIDDTSGGVFELFGHVMNAIANRRAVPQVVENIVEAIDDEDKLPPGITIGSPS